LGDNTISTSCMVNVIEKKPHCGGLPSLGAKTAQRDKRVLLRNEVNGSGNAFLLEKGRNAETLTNVVKGQGFRRG